jgi:hypothetical protein
MDFRSFHLETPPNPRLLTSSTRALLAPPRPWQTLDDKVKALV